MKLIDARSDTVTWPTQAMRAAMAEAPVGDDVYGDDPTVIELETAAAAAVGKPAALFVPSGTFGNQLALFVHCPRGSEVILGEDCHIVQHEAGAAALIAGVQIRPLPAPDGVLDPAAVEARIRVGDDIHCPATSLVCLENAHSSGRVVPLAAMDAVRAVAGRRGLPVHLDGARLFNAAAALGIAPAAIAARADSVMFCLSKGLCAPVGSMLAGSAEFVAAARRKRKPMGGGLRQAGVLAAAGLVALREMAGRLGEDHAVAKALAYDLARIPGIEIDPAAAEINLVFFRHRKLAVPGAGAAFAAALAARGVLANPPDATGLCRLAVHFWIDRARGVRLAAAVGEALAGLA